MYALHKYNTLLPTMYWSDRSNVGYDNSLQALLL